ncbi:MAG: zinc metallopeptidase [Caldilineaceae bacterium]
MRPATRHPDRDSYAALRLRSALVPTVQVRQLAGPDHLHGRPLHVNTFGNSIAWIGLLIFGLTALFAVVTLPVEFSTTKRAKQLLVSKGILAARRCRVNRVLELRPR